MVCQLTFYSQGFAVLNQYFFIEKVQLSAKDYKDLCFIPVIYDAGGQLMWYSKQSFPLASCECKSKLLNM
jgi:hypothetical protein